MPKTAFITKHGLFEFKTMPFSLETTPQTYQMFMELALSGLQWTACLIYIDDVIMYGETFDEHLQRLSMILLASKSETETKQKSFIWDR